MTLDKFRESSNVNRESVMYAVVVCFSPTTEGRRKIVNREKGNADDADRAEKKDKKRSKNFNPRKPNKYGRRSQDTKHRT